MYQCCYSITPCTNGQCGYLIILCTNALTEPSLHVPMLLHNHHSMYQYSCSITLCTNALTQSHHEPVLLLNHSMYQCSYSITSWISALTQLPCTNALTQSLHVSILLLNHSLSVPSLLHHEPVRLLDYTMYQCSYSISPCINGQCCYLIIMNQCS